MQPAAGSSLSDADRICSSPQSQYPTGRGAAAGLSPSPAVASRIPCPSRFTSRIPRRSPNLRRVSASNDMEAGSVENLPETVDSRMSTKCDADQAPRATGVTQVMSKPSGSVPAKTRVVPRANTIQGNQARAQRLNQGLSNTPTRQERPKEHVAAASPAAAAAARRAPSRGVRTSAIPSLSNRGALPDRVTGRTPLANRNGRQIDRTPLGKAPASDFGSRRRATTEEVPTANSPKRLAGSYAKSPRKSSPSSGRHAYGDRMEIENSSVLQSSTYSPLQPVKYTISPEFMSSFRRMRSRASARQQANLETESENTEEQAGASRHPFVNNNANTAANQESFHTPSSGPNPALTDQLEHTTTYRNEASSRADMVSCRLSDEFAESTQEKPLRFSTNACSSSDLCPTSMDRVEPDANCTSTHDSEIESCTVSSLDRGNADTQTFNETPQSVKKRPYERFSMENLNLSDLERLSRSVGRRRRSKGTSGGRIEYPEETPTPTMPRRRLP